MGAGMEEEKEKAGRKEMKNGRRHEGRRGDN
jgi:hypothetical protein